MKKIVTIFLMALLILGGVVWFDLFKLPELRLTNLEHTNSAVPASESTTYLKELSSKHGNHLNYLVLGDSVAKAYGAKSGFFDRVAEYLDHHTNKTVSIQNEAVIGETSDQLIELIKNGSIKKDIQEANIISINVGGDDILSVSSQSQNVLSAINDFASVKSNYQTNLKEILSSISSINPKAIVLVNDLYNVLPPQNKLFSTSEKLLDNWNLVTYTSAQPYKNVAVVPVDQVLTPQKEQEWLTAEVHPNNLGHKWIADQIENELTKKRALESTT